MLLLAIDTGTKNSAYVIVDTVTFAIEEARKIPNDQLMDIVRWGYYDDCVVEMFSSYGNRSGFEVFESIIVIGQIIEACFNREMDVSRLLRKDVKKHICNSISANDADIIRALKDRFGDNGTKEQHGFFWGIKADCWQAFALAVTHIDALQSPCVATERVAVQK